MQQISKNNDFTWQPFYKFENVSYPEPNFQKPISCNFIEKRPYHSCFPENFGIFKNTYFEGHLRTTASILRTLLSICDWALCQKSYYFCRKRYIIYVLQVIEVAVQRCSYKEVFSKYAANLQENYHAKVRF